jgi:hypothetical protein
MVSLVFLGTHTPMKHPEGLFLLEPGLHDLDAAGPDEQELAIFRFGPLDKGLGSPGVFAGTRRGGVLVPADATAGRGRRPARRQWQIGMIVALTDCREEVFHDH